MTRLENGKAVEENIETNVENVDHFKRLWEENWKPKIGHTEGFWVRYQKYLKEIEVDAISQNLE